MENLLYFLLLKGTIQFLPFGHDVQGNEPSETKYFVTLWLNLKEREKGTRMQNLIKI